MSTATKKTGKVQGRKGNKEFVDVFSLNKSDENFLDDIEQDGERDLTGAEKNLLQKFEENDQELEEIAGEICGKLDELKGVAEDMETEIKNQNAQLKNVN
jgi:hypothetical protein